MIHVVYTHPLLPSLLLVSCFSFLTNVRVARRFRAAIAAVGCLDHLIYLLSCWFAQGSFLQIHSLLMVIIRYTRLLFVTHDHYSLFVIMFLLELHYALFKIMTHNF